MERGVGSVGDPRDAAGIVMAVCPQPGAVDGRDLAVEVVFAHGGRAVALTSRRNE